jgi:long-chain acyl-CoA synthetase
MDSFYEENVRKALNTGKTNVRIVITTNITDLMDLNFVKKFLGKILKKIPYGKVIKVKGIKYFRFKEILKQYRGSNDPNVSIEPKNDLAFLQYTGGTTGPPKGAMLTHFNELANIEQTFHWWEIDAEPGEDIYISGFPFFHLAGMFLNLGAIYHGAQQLLVPNPRDMNHICELIDKWKPNLMANVPTLYLNLLNTSDFRNLDLSSIRIYISGAAPFPSKNIEEFEDLVGKHKLLEVYGMTEASPIVSANPYKGQRKVGTVGLPVSNTYVRIVDVENREKEVDLGNAGEIAIKGPQIFKGYWNKPNETKNALKNGWFFSGDVGIMDKEGFISIVDRTKDMINVSGFKVFSVEVDEKMSKHPAIEIASSVGVADPERPGSEIVKLYVLLKDQYKRSEEIKEDILKYARNNLAKYKVPKKLEIVEHIPLTSIGKIDKKALRMR